MPDAPKTVIVVGGSSGIGRATAIRFAREGWRVAVAAPDAEQVRQVTEKLEGAIICRSNPQERRTKWRGASIFSPDRPPFRAGYYWSFVR